MAMLLDTCILIDYMRQIPEAREHIRSISGLLPISLVTVIELYGSVREGRERRQLEMLLTGCDIYEIDHALAVEAGLIFRQYSRSHGIDIPDAIIAATAIIHDLELVTANRKHFPMVKKLTVPYGRR